MEQNKDHSQLRPFDLEAAKAGAKLFYTITVNGETECTFIDADEDGWVCVRYEQFGLSLHRPANVKSYMRMAPLCWVEGKPVYKGDVLYWKDGTSEPGREWTVSRVERGVTGLLVWDDTYNLGGGGFVHTDRLSTTRPVPKPEQPLFHLDGKPVMKGQRLWVKGGYKECWHYADRLEGDRVSQDHKRNDAEPGSVLIRHLAWDPQEPEQPQGRKLWVNVYPSDYKRDHTTLAAYITRELADTCASPRRFACIEIELPPLSEVQK